MAKDTNDHVVIAIFSDEDAAKQASKALQDWDKSNDDIKLGAIGTISKKGDDVKTHVGRKTGSGAKTGAAVGVVAAVLSGGLTLVPGLVYGAVGGGALGTFFKKSLNLNKEEIEELGKTLDGGKVALVVTLSENEVEPTSKELTSLGGEVHGYEVPSEALDEVAAASGEAESGTTTA
jgi:uncharacterized membrane protein